jgi:glycosyltransferase involved in cell wall biosynthesis
MRAPFSAVIITLNAARSLDATLASLAFADEVLVFDSGSSDGTRQITEARGARFMSSEWHGFGHQKQRAVAAARYDWVLCIDADEVVSAELRDAVDAALVARTAKVYALARRNRFMGRWLRHGEGYPDWQIRLFDRRAARWSDDSVHERVLTIAAIERLRGDLLHDSAETMTSYLAKQDRYTDLQASRLASDSRVVNFIRMLTSPIVRFVKFYFVRGGILDGVPGLIHILIGCKNSFTKYAKALKPRNELK